MKPKLNLKIKQAFQVVFAPGTVLNRAYFFVSVPFFTSVLLYVASLDNMGVGLKLIISLVALILNLLFQLYLWSTQFFYAQQISANDWSDYGLILAELFTDFRVKMKLLAIRIIWNIPALLVMGGVIIHSAGSLNDTNVATLQAGMQDPVTTLLSTLFSQGSVVSGILLFGAVIYSQIIAEQILTMLSQYQYAATGSFKQAFNLKKIGKTFLKSWKELAVVTGLAIVPDILLPILMVVLAVLLLIPVVGGLVLGFILGLYYLYNTLFIGNLQGQIWQILEKNSNT